MSNYPIPVMKIAAEVPRLQYQNVETWQALYQRQEHPDESRLRLTYLAADRICQEFVKHVVDTMQIKSYDEAHGKVTRFACVALTEHQLNELLYQAYTEGQSDGMKRSIRMEAVS